MQPSLSRSPLPRRIDFTCDEAVSNRAYTQLTLSTMQITLATLSDYATIDQQGKLSVMGIFDVLGALQFPVLHPQVYVCLRIQCRPIEAGRQHTLRLVCQDQDGSPILPALESPFEVPPPSVPKAPYSYVQVSYGFSGILFHREGTHSFEVAINGVHQASIPLHVVKVSVPATDSDTEE